MTLEDAIHYRQTGQMEEAKAEFSALYDTYPNDPQINYHYAWFYDNLGEESQAVPHYERAIAAGLPDEDLQGALLGLGSTYRTLGEYEKAESTLRLGINKFPDAKEFVVFLAMTLYNLKQHHEAMSALLRMIANDVEGVKPYQRAIRLYADDLDKTW